MRLDRQGCDGCGSDAASNQIEKIAAMHGHESVSRCGPKVVTGTARAQLNSRSKHLVAHAGNKSQLRSLRADERNDIVSANTLSGVAGADKGKLRWRTGW
jgi:hypothetical protein